MRSTHLTILGLLAALGLLALSSEVLAQVPAQDTVQAKAPVPMPERDAFVVVHGPSVPSLKSSLNRMSPGAADATTGASAHTSRAGIRRIHPGIGVAVIAAACPEASDLTKF